MRLVTGLIALYAQRVYAYAADAPVPQIGGACCVEVDKTPFKNVQ